MPSVLSVSVIPPLATESTEMFDATRLCDCVQYGGADVDVLGSQRCLDGGLGMRSFFAGAAGSNGFGFVKGEMLEDVTEMAEAGVVVRFKSAVGGFKEELVAPSIRGVPLGGAISVGDANSMDCADLAG